MRTSIESLRNMVGASWTNQRSGLTGFPLAEKQTIPHIRQVPPRCERGLHDDSPTRETSALQKRAETFPAKTGRQFQKSEIAAQLPELKYDSSNFQREEVWAEAPWIN